MLKTLTPVVTYTARERLDYSELEDVYLVLEEDGTEVRQDNTIQYTNLLLLTRSPYRRQRFSVSPFLYLFVGIIVSNFNTVYS